MVETDMAGDRLRVQPAIGCDASGVDLRSQGSSGKKQLSRFARGKRLFAFNARFGPSPAPLAVGRLVGPATNPRDFSRLQVESFQQLGHGQTVVAGDAFKDACKGACFDGVMMRNHLVVLPVLLGGDTDMRAALPIHGIAQDTKSFYKFRPADIAGDFHRARTSCRTKWSRMTWGASIVSSK